MVFHAAFTDRSAKGFKKDALSLLKQKMRNIPHHLIEKRVSDSGRVVLTRNFKKVPNVPEVPFVSIARRGSCR
jgi:hypothetical protein